MKKREALNLADNHAADNHSDSRFHADAAETERKKNTKPTEINLTAHTHNALIDARFIRF